MLTSPLYFDIDIKRPHDRIRNAVKVVSKLTHTIRRLSQRDPDLLVFSGRNGFHVYYWNWDDIPARYEHPMDRIREFTESRKKLLKRLELEEIDVDRTVTADPWRVLRVPGTLHWDTGFVACRVQEVEDFILERDAAVFPKETYRTVFGIDATVF
jgi:DNA primase catalytic subunit